MTRYISPCEYGTCPSALIRETYTDDAVKQAECMVACSQVLGRIVAAADFQVLVARESSLVDGEEIVFAPSPCPLMTRYSLTIIQSERDS